METTEIMNSCNLSMEFVQSLSGKWAQQFENIPEFPFLFDVNQEGILCFNGKPLCSISDLKLNSEFIDVEEFSFETLSGDVFYFLINWPYDSGIDSVTVYKNDEMIVWASLPDLKVAGNF